MEAGDIPMQAKTVPIYLMVLEEDDDDNVEDGYGNGNAGTCEDAASSEVPAPAAAPAAIQPLETLSATDTPPPVAPRPPETLPQITPSPRPRKSESSEGTDYEEIPIDRVEYEEIPFDHTGHNEVPNVPPIRHRVPLPGIPAQPRHFTAMTEVSSSSQLPVKRRTIILTVMVVLIAIAVASIIAVIVAFSRGKYTMQ